MGVYDLTKSALKELDAEIFFERVSLRPGKPTVFARLPNGTLVFGLPGNPVSAFVTFLLFVRPALLKMMGAGVEELSLPSFDAQLAEEVQNTSDRPHYVRGRVVRGKFTPVGRQESHALFGLSRANALLRIAPGETLRGGDKIPILALD